MSDPSPEAEAPPRLAMSQLRRIRRIVDAAVALAEEGGFEGVRLRDVAEASGVSLGTLYKYFRSKEDVLLTALIEGSERLERVIAERPPTATSPRERVTEFFTRATRGLTRKPHFARAALRSIATGGEEMAVQQAGYHLRMSRIVIAMMRGVRPDPEQPLAVPVGEPHEQQVALVLEHVWYASLLGWASGLHPVDEVVARMATTSALLLEGTPMARQSGSGPA